MLKRSSILIGAGIAVALIIGIYGLAPLAFSGGADTPGAVGGDGPVAESTTASKGTAAGATGTDAAAASGGAARSAGAVSTDADDPVAPVPSNTSGPGASGSGSADTQGTSAPTDSVPSSSGSNGVSSNGAVGAGSGSGNATGATTGSAAPDTPTATDALPSASNPAPNAPAPNAPSSSPSSQLSCTLSIGCSTILGNQGLLDPAKAGLVPSDGVLMAGRSVAFTEGETVYDVLARETRASGIHMESSYVPLYNSAYVEGIGNLYEFDVGELSGWMYCVNGWYPNYGCSAYVLGDGDVIQWNYTCDLGRDLGAGGIVQG